MHKIYYIKIGILIELRYTDTVTSKVLTVLAKGRVNKIL